MQCVFSVQLTLELISIINEREQNAFKYVLIIFKIKVSGKKKRVYDRIFMNLSVKMTDDEKVLRDPWPRCGITSTEKKHKHENKCLAVC